MINPDPLTSGAIGVGDSAVVGNAGDGIVLNGGGVVINAPDSGINISSDVQTSATVVNAGNDGQFSFSGGTFDYTHLGPWAQIAGYLVVGFDQIAGDPVDPSTVPNTGSSSYTGTTSGYLAPVGSTDTQNLIGDVSLEANFSSGAVNADFTNMVVSNGAINVGSPWVEFESEMSLNPVTGQFSGTAASTDGDWTGTAEGGFFGTGSAIPETAAGVWEMQSPTGSAIGGFRADKQ